MDHEHGPVSIPQSSQELVDKVFYLQNVSEDGGVVTIGGSLRIESPGEESAVIVDEPTQSNFLFTILDPSFSKNRKIIVDKVFVEKEGIENLVALLLKDNTSENVLAFAINILKDLVRNHKNLIF